MMVRTASVLSPRFNQRFCTLFGYTEDELIGQRTVPLTPSVEHFEQYYLAFEQAREGLLKARNYSTEKGWEPVLGQIDRYSSADPTGAVHSWSFDDVTIEVIAREEMKNPLSRA